MALLLIDIEKYIGNAQMWRDTLAAQLPQVEVRVWPETGNLADIEYLAFMRPNFLISTPNFLA
jgi:glyoxylate/hydroxypyruvate reductase A